MNPKLDKFKTHTHTHIPEAGEKEIHYIQGNNDKKHQISLIVTRNGGSQKSVNRSESAEKKNKKMLSEENSKCSKNTFQK